MVDRELGKRQDWNAPGHAHELTLSCYRKLKLFTEGDRCRCFLLALEEARKALDYDVWAYVIMPDHVHVLVRPKQREYTIESFRAMLKKRSGLMAMETLRADGATLERLTVRQGDVLRHRFWQIGKGYDRNLWTPPLIWKSIRYIHGNPVKAGLCETPADWPWSSYRFYEG